MPKVYSSSIPATKQEDTMKRNTKLILAATLISGLATGRAALADNHDKAAKPAAEKASCSGKDGCGGKDKNKCDGKNSCKGKDKNECKGKDAKNHCNAKEHCAAKEEPKK